MRQPINPMQAMVDGMSAAWMLERAATQMTLGKFIELLEAMPQDRLLQDIREPHSYRGYYSDLAFEKGPGKVSVADALTMCKGAMGQVFTGYKGGDYVMGALTPLWIASYGSCGLKLIGISDDGELLTAEDTY
jgi:hypothetical protein